VSFSIAMVEPVTSVGGIVNSAAAGLDPLVVALDVVGEKIGRGLALLQHRLLIRFGRGLSLRANCSSVPSGSSARPRSASEMGPD